MPSTVFSSGTVIAADWLNDVNAATYTKLANVSTISPFMGTLLPVASAVAALAALGAAAAGANTDLTSLGGLVQVNGSSVAGFRNRIINGDMTVFQRGVRYANGYGPADRWQTQFVSGTWALAQDTDAPPGFSYSLNISTSTPNPQAATDFYLLAQNVEGVNIKDFGQGFAGASIYTLSFWVKSSIAGTYSGMIASGDNNRSNGFTYNIPVANTWTKVYINILGDVSGGLTAYPRNNLAGLRVKWDLGSGSNYRIGTTGSWSATANVIGVTGSAGIAQTSGAVFKITGVQLELGTVATLFEQRPYPVEYAMCQRYFEFGGAYSFVVVNNLGSGGGYPSRGFMVVKRTNPVVTLSPSAGTGATPASDSTGFYQGTTHSQVSGCSWVAEAEL